MKDLQFHQNLFKSKFYMDLILPYLRKIKNIMIFHLYNSENHLTKKIYLKPISILSIALFAFVTTMATSTYYLFMFLKLCSWNVFLCTSFLNRLLFDTLFLPIASLIKWLLYYVNFISATGDLICIFFFFHFCSPSCILLSLNTCISWNLNLCKLHLSDRS